jgi:hypothetical protein
MVKSWLRTTARKTFRPMGTGGQEPANDPRGGVVGPFNKMGHAKGHTRGSRAIVRPHPAMAIEAALAHAGIVEPRDIMLPCVLPSWPTSTKCCVNSVGRQPGIERGEIRVLSWRSRISLRGWAKLAQPLHSIRATRRARERFTTCPYWAWTATALSAAAAPLFATARSSACRASARRPWFHRAAAG